MELKRHDIMVLLPFFGISNKLNYAQPLIINKKIFNLFPPKYVSPLLNQFTREKQEAFSCICKAEQFGL